MKRAIVMQHKGCDVFTADRLLGEAGGKAARGDWIGDGDAFWEMPGVRVLADAADGAAVSGVRDGV